MPLPRRPQRWRLRAHHLLSNSRERGLRCAQDYAVAITWVFITCFLLSVLAPVSLLCFTTAKETHPLGSIVLTIVPLIELTILYCLSMCIARSRARDRPTTIQTPLPAPFESRTNYARRDWVNVFLVGGPCRGVNLVVPPDTSVDDLLCKLRQRHIIRESPRLSYSLRTSLSCDALNLRGDQNLRDLQISNNSTLFFRMHCMGGVDSLQNPTGPETTTFNTSTGIFSSPHPDRWQPLVNKWFQCSVCDKSVSYRYLAKHEESREHRHRLRFWTNPSSEPTPTLPTELPQPPSSGYPSTSPATEDAPSSSVTEALGSLLKSYESNTLHESPPEHDHTRSPSPGIDWSSTVFEDYSFYRSFEERGISALADRFAKYTLNDGALDVNSDDEAVDEERYSDEDSDQDGLYSDNIGVGTRKGAEKVSVDSDNPWFPWPNKETCVLDILRHVPRSVFSQKENAVIHWALLSLGVKDVPSEHQMKDVKAFLQDLCGVQSIRYKGSLGHVYYVNDLAAILAQEMANPKVRPHLRFLPEDSGKRLSEARQGRHWLHHMDPELLTPMIRAHGQDFYTFEPTLATDGSVYMPHRWFQKGEDVFARAWVMVEPASRPGWVVLEHQSVDLPLADLILSFPNLKEVFHDRGLADPSRILGVQHEPDTIVRPWTRTSPEVGNSWRKKSKSHRVLAVPIWLYCDDTSGNQSKKWNKHNSFLFTLGGLARRLLHQEYSIHFLSTSNLAPPLEMLEGIEKQLSECQSSGVWTWDCELREPVLIIPSVLAMLGDNPMQSEMASHIGLNGKMFCRACMVEGDEREEEDATAGTPPQHTNPGASATEDEGHLTDASSDSHGGLGEHRAPLKKKRKHCSKKSEKMDDTIARVNRFMSANSRQRTREGTLDELRQQLEEAKRIGGFTSLKNRRTNSGIKDTHLDYFTTKLTDVSKSRKISRADKTARMNALIAGFPDDEQLMSPVWRLKGVDPHSQTPVEVLHVIQLGFVKYFWRDAIARLSEPNKVILAARLSSFDTAGLGIPPLAGHTLVKYAGSLTGRDFRAISQAAPFVLHDLGLPDEKLKAWASLSNLVSLVWVPEIDDVEVYLARIWEVQALLRTSIDYFLDSTCALTPRWFNKPKFHIILHLPTHIANFGPAMLFATEGFESFNAVIRSHSIHSNRHAPSRDIAHSMAQCNRVRHLLSGGFFVVPSHPSGPRPKGTTEKDESLSRIAESGRSPWKHRFPGPVSHGSWRSIGSYPQKVLDVDEFGTRILGLEHYDDAVDTDIRARSRSGKGLQCHYSGICSRLSAFKFWNDTILSRASIPPIASSVADMSTKCVRLASQVFLSSGDMASIGSWVLWRNQENRGTGDMHTRPFLGRVVDIVQIDKTLPASRGEADLVIVQEANVGGMHDIYNMPQATLLDNMRGIPPQNLIGTVNVQHNCRDHGCSVTRTRLAFQEREETIERANEVTHKPHQDYIFNTSQMRSSSLIMPFRSPPPRLDREQIVFDSVKIEVDAAKERHKASHSVKVPPSGAPTTTLQSAEVRDSREVNHRRPSSSSHGPHTLPGSSTSWQMQQPPYQHPFSNISHQLSPPPAYHFPQFRSYVPIQASPLASQPIMHTQRQPQTPLGEVDQQKYQYSQ